MVLVGFPYQGQWYAPGGSSYMSTLLEDAGAVYPWKEIAQHGSMVIDFEEVYRVGRQATHWLVVGQLDSLSQVLATDARFAQFTPVQLRQVYNSNKRKNARGWIEYYETSVVYPHYALADLCALFHPELWQGHSFFYFQVLPD